MRIAFVYDRINKWGGAERVLLALHEIWPNAPLYTAVYDPKRAPWAKVFRVIPSFLNKFPLARSLHEFYPWLTPLAFESFDFSEFDIVISVTSAEAKGIITKPKTLHLCYCLTPTRYLWSSYDDYFSSPASQFVSLPVVSYLRSWDKIAAQRPDVYWVTCKNVQKRIKKYYSRESEIVYPPIETDKFTPLSKSYQLKARSYFLLVSRLVAYKKIDIAVKAFNKLGLPLKIIGTGNQLKRLKRMARENIEFLGQLTDRELIRYYSSCQAVIFPQEEDFGLVPLEAQACGKPVIAFKGGGALETVVEGRTGLFFYPQTPVALARAVERFKSLKARLPASQRGEPARLPARQARQGLRAEDCQKNAGRFSKERFKKEFKKKVEEEWRKFQKKN